MVRRCNECIYFHKSAQQCRRRAPSAMAPLAEHNSDLLRDAAVSLRALAKIDANEASDIVEYDADGQQGMTRWPYVAEDDWCGEFRVFGDGG